VPLDGARSATGKLLLMNFFIIVPLLNFTYWFLLWARRRTLALGKMPTTERGAALLSPQPVPAGRRWLFEHSADYRDLRLDGRHWQAQFGGASRPNDEPVGAYVCCNSVAFAVTRFLFAFPNGVYTRGGTLPQDSTDPKFEEDVRNCIGRLDMEVGTAV